VKSEYFSTGKRATIMHLVRSTTEIIVEKGKESKRIVSFFYFEWTRITAQSQDLPTHQQVIEKQRPIYTFMPKTYPHCQP